MTKNGKEIDVGASGRKALNLGDAWVWRSAKFNEEGELVVDMALPKVSSHDDSYSFCIYATIPVKDFVYR